MLGTFRSRLIGILVFINMCVLLLGGGAFYFLGEVSGRLETFTKGIYARLEIANRLRDAATERAIAVRNVALLSDEHQRAEQAKEFERLQAETQKTMEELQTAAAAAKVPEEVSRKISEIAQIEARYSPIAESIVHDLMSGKRDAGIAQIESTCTPTLAALSAALRDYMVLTEKRTRAYVAETESISRWESNALFVAAIAAAALAATLGYLLRRNVRLTLGVEPEELKASLARLADGDLATSSELERAGKESVAFGVARVSHKIGAIVREVHVSCENIATGTAEIASGNADLSQRTEQQASSLQQTAATMEQLGDTVRSNAENAKQANQLAQGAAAVAAQGGKVVSEVVATMQGINESSRKIGDIIGVIDGIAFQTNIPALNAAVEAARAGEQGRGFAVVAGEVRTLAQRSAEAAREIKALIGRNVDQVSQGTGLVDQAGKTMAEIVVSIRSVSDIVAEIASASVEQSNGVQQVGEAVVQMDRGTQQNAALVEQSAAAAESLKAQAQQLVQAVMVFKLDNRNGPDHDETVTKPIAERKATVSLNQAATTPRTVTAAKPKPVALANKASTKSAETEVVLAGATDSNGWTDF